MDFPGECVGVVCAISKTWMKRKTGGMREMDGETEQYPPLYFPADGVGTSLS